MEQLFGGFLFFMSIFVPGVIWLVMIEKLVFHDNPGRHATNRPELIFGHLISQQTEVMRIGAITFFGLINYMAVFLIYFIPSQITSPRLVETVDTQLTVPIASTLAPFVFILISIILLIIEKVRNWVVSNFIPFFESWRPALALILTILLLLPTTLSLVGFYLTYTSFSQPFTGHIYSYEQIDDTVKFNITFANQGESPILIYNVIETTYLPDNSPNVTLEVGHSNPIIALPNQIAHMNNLSLKCNNQKNLMKLLQTSLGNVRIGIPCLNNTFTAFGVGKPIAS